MKKKFLTVLLMLLFIPLFIIGLLFFGIKLILEIFVVVPLNRGIDNLKKLLSRAYKIIKK